MLSDTNKDASNGDIFNLLTDAGLTKKVRHRTVCPLGAISLRASFYFAPCFLKVLDFVQKEIFIFKISV